MHDRTKFSSLVLTLVVSFSVYATGLTVNKPPVSTNAQPCKKIEDACIAAGYFKHGHKGGKGLWKQCMQPLLNGRSVASVSVTPADISACRAKRAAKKLY